MRQCPTCSRTYPDDSLRFCLDDGTPLSATNDPDATLVMSRTESPTKPAVSSGTAAPSTQKLIYIAIAIGALLLGGATVALLKPTGNDAPAANTSASSAPVAEISVDPSVLRDEQLLLANIRLHGVKLGDPESKIPNDVVTERTKYADGRPSGWLLCRDASGFRVSNGRVVEFKLGPPIVQKLNLLREDQIELAFGKADKITPEDYGTSNVFYRRYTYIARHMHVNWSVKDGRLGNLLITE